MSERRGSIRGTSRGALVAVGACLAVAALAGQAAPPSSAADWPQWRGPGRDAAVPSAPSSWPEELTKGWSVDVGLGYATPLLVGNRVYQFSRQGESEVMS